MKITGGKWQVVAGVQSGEEGNTMSWRNERGMALLITVMTLSLLFAVTVQYQRSTWHKFTVSHNHKVGIQLKAIAASGVEIARALLESDGKTGNFDTEMDLWANIDNEDFADLFPNGRLALTISDLSGRLQVNSLVQTGKSGTANTEEQIRAVLLRLLLSGSFAIEDEVQARQIVDALVDWLDADDRESDFGAENSYYRSLDPPYSCKNGPVEYLEELLLVAGMTPELLFGSAGKKGLADYLTVSGDDGRINLNTAPLLLIKSLDPLIDDELVTRLDEYRRQEGGAENLAKPDWYKNIGGWPGDIALDEKVLTTQSTHFLVSATGLFDTLTKHISAVVLRSSGGQTQLLAQKVE